jgi:hypothetical protein
VATKRESETKQITISPPDIQTAQFHIIGTSPYVQLRFTEKAMNVMREKMEAGPEAAKRRVYEARDFDEDYKKVFHRSTEDWFGIPASALRKAMISACKLVNFKMTLAKLTIWVLPDGFDAIDGGPLIRIYGEPEKIEMIVRNANGQPDIRVRAMWREWNADVRIQFDHGQFKLIDITNLLMRVGYQVGIGEGRPDSKNSIGMGWGTFRLESSNE